MTKSQQSQQPNPRDGSGTGASRAHRWGENIYVDPVHPPPTRKGRTPLDADVVALLLENVSPENTDGLNALQTEVAKLTKVDDASTAWLSRFSLLAIRRAVQDAAARRDADLKSEPIEVVEALHLLALGNYETADRSNLGVSSAAMFSAIHSTEEILADLRSHGSKRRRLALKAAGLNGDHSAYKYQAPHVWLVASTVLSALRSFAHDEHAVAEVADETDRSQRPAEVSTAAPPKEVHWKRGLTAAIAVLSLSGFALLVVSLGHDTSQTRAGDSSAPATVATIREVGQVSNGDIMRIRTLTTSTPSPTFSSLSSAKIGDTLIVRERLDSVGPYPISKAHLTWRQTSGADSFASVFAELSGGNMNPPQIRAQTTVRFSDASRACIVQIPETTNISLVDGSGEQRISDHLVGRGLELPTLDVATYLVSTQFKVVDAGRCE